MKKCLIISLIMMLVILGAWVAPVKAATGSVGISSTSVTVGDTVRVTINFGEKVKAAQCRLDYDTSMFTYNTISGGAQFNTGDHTIVYLNPSYKAELLSVTLSFTAKGTGKANFSVIGLKVATATQTNITPSMSNLATSTTVNPKPDPKPDTKPDPKPDDKPNQGGNSGNNSGSNTNKPTTPTFTGGTATVYAKETVSIRDSWSTSGKLLGTLQKGKSITRTGIGSNGWTRVNYNGKVAYISSQYLTTTKPKDDDKKDDDKKDDDKKDDKNNTTNNTTNNETNNEVNNTTNNIENDEVNSTTNELTNNEHQGSNEVKNEKKDNKNYIEFIIIGVIILAILVIIVSEILAKKKSKQKKGRK